MTITPLCNENDINRHQHHSSQAYCGTKCVWCSLYFAMAIGCSDSLCNAVSTYNRERGLRSGSHPANDPWDVRRVAWSPWGLVSLSIWWEDWTWHLHNYSILYYIWGRKIKWSAPVFLIEKQSFIFEAEKSYTPWTSPAVQWFRLSIAGSTDSIPGWGADLTCHGAQPKKKKCHYESNTGCEAELWLIEKPLGQ